MSTNLQAWLLCVAPAAYALLPRQTMGHLVDDFEVHHVPQAPAYANHVYLWKRKILPVFNFSALLLGGRQPPKLLGIVAYRRCTEIKQGTIALFDSPQLVDVSNEVAAWPEGSIPWPELADSCVEIKGFGACPIISTDKLFNFLPKN